MAIRSLESKYRKDNWPMNTNEKNAKNEKVTEN